MRHRALFLSSTLLIFLAFILPCAASSDQTDALSAFLQPVNAQVIMPIESGALIDKGAEDGINQGDILTVVRGQTALRHPSTGETLDTVAEYGTHLVVTRVKPQLSYARTVGADPGLAEGTRVRRFGNVPVYFVDPSGEGFQLFRIVRQRLPQLLWKDYLKSGKSPLREGQQGLVIRYDPGEVTVENQEGRILFLQKLAAQPQPASAGPQPIQSPRQNAAAGWQIRRLDIELSGEIGALKVSDLDRDGRPEILVALDADLFVYHLDNQNLVEVSHLALTDWQRVIDLSALDLDGDGNREIIASGLFKNRGEMRVIRFSDFRLSEVTRARMVAATYSPLDGTPFLIGMNNYDILDRQGQLYRLSMAGEKLFKEPFALPKVHQVYGVVPLSTDDGKKWLASLSSGHKVVVRDEKGQIRWESEGGFGGSTAGIKINLQGKKTPQDFEMLYFRAKLERTPQGTLLVTQHEGPGFLKNSPNYKKGRMVELAWNGTVLEGVLKSDSLGGMLVDFDQYNLEKNGRQDIFAGLVYRQRGFFRKPISGLVILSNR